MPLVDLSHDVVHGMVTYPGLPGPVISDYLGWEESGERYAPGTEFRIGRIDLVANTGTYLDTPAHRYRSGDDLARLALERCADLVGVCVRVAESTIGPEAFAGVDVAGLAVLFATGWDVHWGSDSYGDPEHPHLTRDAATALVARRAALIGIDSVNIDATTGGERPVHSILLAAGIPIVEHLTGLDRLADPAGGELPFRFFAVPVKVADMGTFPVRAFAITG